MKSMLERISDILAELGVPRERVQSDAQISDLLDPIQSAQFVLLIEDEFGFSLSADDLSKLKTLQDIADDFEMSEGYVANADEMRRSVHEFEPLQREVLEGGFEEPNPDDPSREPR